MFVFQSREINLVWVFSRFTCRPSTFQIHIARRVKLRVFSSEYSALRPAQPLCSRMATVATCRNMVAASAAASAAAASARAAAAAARSAGAITAAATLVAAASAADSAAALLGAAEICGQYRRRPQRKQRPSRSEAVSDSGSSTKAPSSLEASQSGEPLLASRCGTGADLLDGEPPLITQAASGPSATAARLESGSFAPVKAFNDGAPTDSGMAMSTVHDDDAHEELEELDELSNETKCADPLFRAKVLKACGEKYFDGYIEDIEVGVRSRQRLYLIRYSDGDVEHVSEAVARQCSRGCG